MTGTPVSTKVSTLMFEPNGPIAIFSAMSSTRTVGHSFAIPKLPQVGFDRRIQPRRFLLLFTPLGTESLHLFCKWFAIVFLFRRAHIAAGGEHMAVLADLLQRRGLAEAGHVGVFARVLLASPSMVGIGDLLNIGFTEFAPGAVHQRAHVAGVDKQHFAAPDAQSLLAALAIGLVAGQEPEAGRDLSGVEQLAG